jgi:hypothetical protein
MIELSDAVPALECMVNRMFEAAFTLDRDGIFSKSLLGLAGSVERSAVLAETNSVGVRYSPYRRGIHRCWQTSVLATGTSPSLVRCGSLCEPSQQCRVKEEPQLRVILLAVVR